MKRVPIRLGVFLVIAVAGAMSLLWWTGPTHRITREMQEQVREGMTLAEVEAILGCAPGHHFAGPAAIKVDGMKTDIGGNCWVICENEQEIETWVAHNPDAYYHYTWITWTGAVAVDCDAEYRVINSSFCEIEPRSRFQRLQLWLLTRF